MKKRGVFFESKKFFVITLLLSVMSILPLIIPIMYLDSHPIYMIRYSNNDAVQVYISILSRYHIAYLPMFLTSFAMLMVSLAGMKNVKLVALDYIFLILVAYTVSSVPLLRILSIPIHHRMVSDIHGTLVTLYIKNIDYTWIYYLLKYPILMMIGLFLSISLAIYIATSKELSLIIETEKENQENNKKQQ